MVRHWDAFLFTELKSRRYKTLFRVSGFLSGKIDPSCQNFLLENFKNKNKDYTPYKMGW